MGIGLGAEPELKLFLELDWEQNCELSSEVDWELNWERYLRIRLKAELGALF